MSVGEFHGELSELKDGLEETQTGAREAQAGTATIGELLSAEVRIVEEITSLLGAAATKAVELGELTAKAAEKSGDSVGEATTVAEALGTHAATANRLLGGSASPNAEQAQLAIMRAQELAGTGMRGLDGVKREAQDINTLATGLLADIEVAEMQAAGLRRRVDDTAPKVSSYGDTMTAVADNTQAAIEEIEVYIGSS
jgi:uncharacterized phage infection (PIP) family protein YhgE